jgi:beta-N-acetylhexosaminidase
VTASSSLARLCGQLLSVGFEGTSAPAELRARLAASEVVGVILFRPNIVDLPQVAALVAALRSAAPAEARALISIDQEGGLVQRVRAPATVWPPMLAVGAAGDAARTTAVGRALGEELAALGIGWDFAPVLDVHTNPANPVIGNRAFGSSVEAVAAQALAFWRGLRAAGLVGCGKHFPGHGDTDTDSHLELPRIDHAWSRLEAVELAPFARARALPMIMTAHVVFAALDPDRPATISEAVVTGLLRTKLGFGGVIVSDDLDMRAIAGHMGADHAAVAAIRAGCDALLLCRDEANQALAEEGLATAAERDSELRRRIGESAARVRAMKQAHAAHQAAYPAPPRAIVGSAAHRRLAERLAGRA